MKLLYNLEWREIVGLVKDGVGKSFLLITMLLCNLLNYSYYGKSELNKQHCIKR